MDRPGEYDCKQERGHCGERISAGNLINFKTRQPRAPVAFFFLLYPHLCSHLSLVRRSLQCILYLQYVFQCSRIRQPDNIDGICQGYINRAAHTTHLARVQGFLLSGKISISETPASRRAPTPTPTSTLILFDADGSGFFVDLKQICAETTYRHPASKVKISCMRESKGWDGGMAQGGLK